MRDKPVKAKPHFYAQCLPALQEIAKDCGYNLIAHGSFNRDFDLVAIPWVDNPLSHYALLSRMERWLKGVYYSKIEDYNGSALPGGRITYHIDLNRGGKFNNYTDEQWYLDISFTPFVKHKNS